MSFNFTDNYFELFGMQSGFVIDSKTLEDKYRELQSLLHPDRYATASAQEQRLAVQGAALINQAYAVLSDDCARATYLLELQGSEFNDQPNTVHDSEFLSEQMALREALEDSAADDNPTETLAHLEERTANYMNELIERFKLAYDRGDFPAAREWVLKMKFIKKFRDEVSSHRRGIRRRRG